jgi:hypothetical protein
MMKKIRVDGNKGKWSKSCEIKHFDPIDFRLELARAAYKNGS